MHPELSASLYALSICDPKESGALGTQVKNQRSSGRLSCCQLRTLPEGQTGGSRENGGWQLLPGQRVQGAAAARCPAAAEFNQKNKTGTFHCFGPSCSTQEPRDQDRTKSLLRTALLQDRSTKVRGLLEPTGKDQAKGDATEGSRAAESPRAPRQACS